MKITREIVLEDPKFCNTCPFATHRSEINWMGFKKIIPHCPQYGDLELEKSGETTGGLIVDLFSYKRPQQCIDENGL